MGWNRFAVAALGLVRDSPNLPLSNSGKVAQVPSQPMLELACFWTLSSIVWGGCHANFSATEELDLVRRSQCYLITWNLSNFILHCSSTQTLLFRQAEPSPDPNQAILFSSCFTLPWVALLFPLSAHLLMFISPSDSTPTWSCLIQLPLTEVICFSSPSGTWWYVILCSSFICLSFLPPNCKLSKERNEIFSFPHFLSIAPITEYFLMNWIGEFIIILQLGKQWQPVREELSHSHPVTEMEKC